MKRPYTGNKDGAAAGEHPQLTALMRELFKAYGPALWNNGSWGVRKMRNKSSLSVHATGRAVDISWRNMGDGKRGVAKGGRKYAMEAMQYLVKHADELGVEMIIDYFPSPHGRAAKCDRDMAWQKYTKPTVSGAPSGDWFHLECDGKKSSEQIKAVFAAYPPAAANTPVVDDDAETVTSATATTTDGLFGSFMEAVRALHPNSPALKSDTPVLDARKQFPKLYAEYQKAGLVMDKGGIVASPTPPSRFGA